MKNHYSPSFPMNNSRQATAEELRPPTKFNYVQLTADGATAVTMTEDSCGNHDRGQLR